MISEMIAIDGGGGVVRDHLKTWVIGFALNKGSGRVLKAELWSILEGLKLVWQYGFRKIIVEIDSKLAVDIPSKASPHCHLFFYNNSGLSNRRRMGSSMMLLDSREAQVTTLRQAVDDM
ncbi:hypothetical protein Ddye_026100 [Dipteronia dyeriana]|uniref:RNase H type-1 domain-containing protein n=1 Tax=Dipteronia dyeriana TaxID=168575 RepID=A0AAD9TML6_9ROSI|nr:hypothetical protein Ddye_026100 [Dipteronia dyeriana]